MKGHFQKKCVACFKPFSINRVHANGGRTLQKGVFLPSACLLETPFLEPLLQKRTPFSDRFLFLKPTAIHLLSKNPSWNLLEGNVKNLLRKGEFSHDPLGFAHQKKQNSLPWSGGCCLSQTFPCPSFPCFWGFPCFLLREDFLVFLSVFPFFSQQWPHLIIPKQGLIQICSPRTGL